LKDIRECFQVKVNILIFFFFKKMKFSSIITKHEYAAQNERWDQVSISHVMFLSPFVSLNQTFNVLYLFPTCFLLFWAEQSVAL
jgi:hypothetical protein